MPVVIFEDLEPLLKVLCVFVCISVVVMTLVLLIAAGLGAYFLYLILV